MDIVASGTLNVTVKERQNRVKVGRRGIVTFKTYGADIILVVPVDADGVIVGKAGADVCRAGDHISAGGTAETIQSHCAVMAREAQF